MAIPPRRHPIRTFLETYPHVWYLLIWIVYLMLFWLAEHLIVDKYWVSHLPIDDQIPFCRFFIIPYCTWHPLLFLMTVYLFFTDAPAFKRFVVYIGLGFGGSILFCMLFPNGQDLRLRRRHQHQRASEHARHRLRGIDARVLRCAPAACKKAASGDADAGRADQRLNGFCQAALDARCARCHSGERCFVPDRLSSVPQKPAQTECITPRPFPDRGDGRFLLPKCCFFGKAVI